MEDLPVKSNPKTETRWVKLKNFLKTPRGKAVAVAIAGVIVLALAGVVAYGRYFADDASSTGQGSDKWRISNRTVEDEKPVTEPSVVDGIDVDPSIAKRRPLAVMIENHPEARPQAGLDKTSQVWEAIVEGGITRFMGVFSSQEADKIGPIRSARPYFIAWASGYHALYAHAGGSQAGLALLGRTDDVVDLPHTTGYFHREPQAGVASEHTLFSSTSDLYDFAKKKDVSLNADFDFYQYQDDSPVADRPASATVTVDFSSPSYLVGWEFNPQNNLYYRSLAGSPHNDRITGDQLTAKNIVAVTVSRRYDPNTNQGKGEWFMDTEGEGSAMIFQNGQALDATWKKPSSGSSLKLYDSTGSEIKLVKGRTWFEVVPPDVTVSHEEATEPKPTTTETN